MTLKERVLWDLKPFNYRGPAEARRTVIMDTILNCFVLIPVGVFLCYLFKKPNVLRDAAICLGFTICIELLQFATMLGNPATEDLITNLVGYFIGFGLYMLLFRRLSVKHTIYIAIAVNIIFAVIVVYSFISTARAYDLIYQLVTHRI